MVEFRGEGLSAFAGCVDRLAPYPVSLNGEPAGELTCQLQTPVRVGCGNLGDSRAVRMQKIRPNPSADDSCFALLRSYSPFSPFLFALLLIGFSSVCFPRASTP